MAEYLVVVLVIVRFQFILAPNGILARQVERLRERQPFGGHLRVALGQRFRRVGPHEDGRGGEVDRLRPDHVRVVVLAVLEAEER